MWFRQIDLKYVRSKWDFLKVMIYIYYFYFSTNISNKSGPGAWRVNRDLQSAVTAHLSSEQLLPFGYAEQPSPKEAASEVRNIWSKL